MALELFLISGLFLGWALGRNNMSNLFGAAIYTRMIQPQTATTIAIIFVAIGTLFGSSGPSASMSAFANPTTMAEGFVICLAAGLVLYGLTFRGVPVSIAQAMVGSAVGWAIFNHALTQTDLLYKTIATWVYSPFLAAGVSFIIFKLMRLCLRVFPLSLLYRDVLTRFGLVLVGAFSAYTLGANNAATIATPYFGASSLPPFVLLALVCMTIGLGFALADKKVIRTMGSGLFPLMPIEALIVVFSGALTLLLFSSGGLRAGLTYLGLPSFPLVPVPISSSVIGSIIGVSFAKGGYGLRYNILGNIAISWTCAPLLSGLICWMGLAILSVIKGL